MTELDYKIRDIFPEESIYKTPVRQNMFTAFFTTKPLGEGTGLGLSITRSIIEDKHKGRIEVASEEDLFTRFTIRIPIVCGK